MSFQVLKVYTSYTVIKSYTRYNLFVVVLDQLLHQHSRDIIFHNFLELHIQHSLNKNLTKILIFKLFPPPPPPPALLNSQSPLKYDSFLLMLPSVFYLCQLVLSNITMFRVKPWFHILG